MPPVCAFTRYRSSFFRSRQSGEYLLQQRVEIRPVVFHLDVAQLMDHHQVHGRIRTVHEKTGEAQAVLSAAAAVAGAGGGDP